MKIDKGVPLPIKSWITSEYTRTLEEMEEGDSVLYPSAKEADAMRSAGIYRGYKMKKHREDGGYRVWLVEREPKTQPKKPDPRKAPALAAVISAPLVKVQGE